VLVQAKTPKKLTKEQKAAIQHLAKVLPPDKVEVRKPGQESDDRGVFGRVRDLFS
jgi:DnaJ-class molecular chaperone